MKKTLRIMSVTLVLAVLISTLAGCESVEKKKAFMDYASSLQSDADKLNEIQTSMDTVNDAINKRDYTTIKANLQAKINPALVELNKSADARHASITDAELATIDAHYVGYTKHMSDGFALLLDGINTEDQAKLNKAMGEMQVAMTEISTYASGLKGYMDSYGIKDDGTMAEVQAMLSGN